MTTRRCTCPSGSDAVDYIVQVTAATAAENARWPGVGRSVYYAR